MLNNVIIHFDGDRSRLVLFPTFLPAPQADLRKVLRYADQTGETEEVCRTFLQNADHLSMSYSERAARYDAEQLKTLGIMQTVMQERDEARARLKAEKDPGVKEAIKDSVPKLTKRIQDLGEARRSELRAKIDYERDLEKLKKNREVIEAWQNRRK